MRGSLRRLFCVLPRVDWGCEKMFAVVVGSWYSGVVRVAIHRLLASRPNNSCHLLKSKSPSEMMVRTVVLDVIHYQSIQSKAGHGE